MNIVGGRRTKLTLYKMDLHTSTSRGLKTNALISGWRHCSANFM